jgi:multidrug efflux pump subunit AcrA (membrane-fusion protein)
LSRLSRGTVSDQELTAARLAVDSQIAKIASLESDHTSVLSRLIAITAQNQVFDAMIAAAKVKVSENELALARTRIDSPVDGVVLELKAAPGQKKLLRMDDPDSATVAVLFETGKLQARVDVPLAEARQLAPGQAALITSDFLPNAEFKGIVSRIVGAADLQRNTLQAKVRVIEPDPRLRPEMLCRVKFLANHDGNTPHGTSAPRPSPPDGSRSVMAPSECLIDRDHERATAWVVGTNDSRAERRELELGHLEIDGYIAVRTGLLAGEALIRPPHDGIKEGHRIKPVRRNP